MPCVIEIRSIEQSRAEANCALFASCEALETLYPVRFGGFVV